MAPQDVPSPQWAPSPKKVASYIAQRFDGQEPSDYTVPTRDQVQSLITDRVTEVRYRCGRLEELDEVPVALAAETVALGTAAYIESAMFPEQGGGDTSLAVFLRRRYEEHVSLLRRHVLYAHRATRAQQQAESTEEEVAR